MSCLLDLNKQERCNHNRASPPFEDDTLRFFRIVKEQTANSREKREVRREARAGSLPRLTSCFFLPAMLVELIGFEPTTPCLQSRCSPS